MTLYRSFSRQATRALEPVELELWEYDVLSALRRQGKPYTLPATRLARETGLSSGAMTNRIDRLESRGLVLRKPDSRDRRGVNVSLTSQGRKLIDRAIQYRLDSAQESLQGLTARQQRELASLLRIAVLAAPDTN
jgi:DNA-binding MarR family transcriptional regulator